MQTDGIHGESDVLTFNIVRFNVTRDKRASAPMANQPSDSDSSVGSYNKLILYAGVGMLFTTPVADLFGAGVSVLGIPFGFLWALSAFVVMGIPIYRLSRQFYSPPE